MLLLELTGYTHLDSSWERAENAVFGSSCSGKCHRGCQQKEDSSSGNARNVGTITCCGDNIAGQKSVKDVGPVMLSLKGGANGPIKAKSRSSSRSWQACRVSSRLLRARRIRSAQRSQEHCSKRRGTGSGRNTWAAIGIPGQL